MSACMPNCWEPVYCRVCGRPYSPIGRAVATEAASGYCDPHDPCDPSDKRWKPHLWSQHDSTRHYADPEGWAAHEASCDQCRPEEEP